jgi:hypothetical protein
VDVFWLLACAPGVLEAKEESDGIVVPPDPTTTDLPATIDADGDGYGTAVDCDDANPAVHPDVEEVCDPLDVDENCDGLSDEEDPSLTCGEDVQLAFDAHPALVDVAIVLDVTASMGGAPEQAAAALQDAYVAMVAEGLFPTWGAAAARDYAASPFGTADSPPFTLVHSQSADVDAVAGALRGVVTGGGGDLPDAGHEALYQAITGLGYDMNCNGDDDPGDVLPFLPAPDDAFGGTTPGGFDPTGAAAGLVPGMGWVENSLRVAVLLTDAPLRDPDAGDDAPDGCAQDAGSSDVIAAALASHVLVVGALADGAPAPARAALEALAVATGGVRLDGAPAVSTWEASGDALVADVIAVLDAAPLGDVDVVVASDPDHHVSAIAPEQFLEVTHGDDLLVGVTLDGLAASGPGDGVDVVLIDLRSSLGFTLVRHTIFVK